MVPKRDPIDPQALNEEVQAIWEENAAFWDEAMGEGNAFQRILIGPAAERLLNLRPGERVLDLACGNGVFSRRMAQLGARVLACDFSSAFIERAKEHTTEYAGQIEYRVVDLIQADELLALKAAPDSGELFDAAYCGMAIQDMTEIEPLFAALAQLLRLGGRFVFSIPHPAFNSAYIRKVIEEEDREGVLTVQYAIKITGYIEPRTDKGLGIIGQPAAQYYFHRPISQVYNTAFQHGFVLDGIEEPVFQSKEEANRPFSWPNYNGIPPALVSRMRLPAA